MESAFIPPGSFEACLQLVAADDDKAEGDEVFTIVFKTMNPIDIISDDDGEGDITQLHYFVLW